MLDNYVNQIIFSKQPYSIDTDLHKSTIIKMVLIDGTFI